MFTDIVEASLSFTIKDKTYLVGGANIKKCELELQVEGFSGMLKFWLSDEGKGDKLKEPFVSNEIIYLELSLKNHTFSKQKKSEPIILKAIVQRRILFEPQYAQMKENNILFRKYYCEFTDVAQFLWRQHFPCKLYLNKPLKHMISEQVVKPITMKYNWDKLTQNQPMMCLGLGAESYPDLGVVSGNVRGTVLESTSVSFYEFLLNFLAHNCAWLIYDYATNTYQITGKKETPKDELSFLPEHFDEIHQEYPRTNVQNVNLLNGHSEQAKIVQVKKNKLKMEITVDRLLVTPFAKTFEEQKKIETQYSVLKSPEICLQFNSYPMKAVFPGAGICLDHKLWNNKLLYYKKKHRITTCGIELLAVNKEPVSDLNTDFTSYTCKYQCICEEYPAMNFKLTQKLMKPICVEGVVLSEPGEETDTTFQYHKNEETKQLQYRIQIPLWDQEIKLLFKPDFIPGHFYFPLNKGVRVELEMNLFEAKITRVLDWGKGVFLEQDTQGNHLLFGKNNTDETSLRHSYEDKKPVFSIKRTKEKDTELVRLEEGKIILQTKEDD